MVSVLCAVSQIADHLCITHEDVVLCMRPLCEITTFSFMISALKAGATVVLSSWNSDKEARSLFEAIHQYRISILPIVPDVARAIVYCSVRELLPYDTKSGLVLDEAAGPVTMPRDFLAFRKDSQNVGLIDWSSPGSCGSPMRNREIHLLHPPSMRLNLSFNANAEITVTGTDMGWYRTGAYGLITPTGELFLAGQKPHM